MPVPADGDVVMHGHAKGLRHIDDGAGDLDVGLRRRRIAAPMRAIVLN
jgi:hypothetical protein